MTDDTTSTERIPISVPTFTGKEWVYLKECLDSRWVSSVGPFVERFERQLAGWTGAKHAVATMNGTSALHMALLVAGVQPGEEVIVSAVSFIAPANAVRYVGAWPVFMDADPHYWQMDPEKLKEFLTRECRWRDGALYNHMSGRRVRAILPVDSLGHPCDWDAIAELARRYELLIIEDAAESLGALYKTRKAGHLGDIACLSFNGNKIITTGGGGMLLTDRAEWADRARYLSTQAKDDPDEYIHQEIGYNYRLTNIQAALGCAQMEQLEPSVAAKRRIAQTYAAAFARIPGITGMREAPWAKSIFWLYTILVDPSMCGLDRRALARSLREAGVQSRPLWQPLSRSPAHREAYAYRCEVADRLYQQALQLPSSAGLSEPQHATVIEAVRKGAARG